MITLDGKKFTAETLAILAHYLERYVDDKSVSKRSKTPVLKEGTNSVIMPDGKLINFKINCDIYQYVCNSDPNQYAYAVAHEYIGNAGVVYLSYITLKFSSD